jgi:hypothetical protein
VASVWIEQVDRGLIDFIEGIVDIVDLTVRPRQTNEGNSAEFPAVTFFSYDEKLAEYRQKRFDELGSKNEVEGTAQMLRPLVPYDLFYQVDFWAESQYEINEMLRKWEGRVEKHNLLPVLDIDGNSKDIKMERVDFANADYTKNGEKRFHRTFTYKIKVELDERDSYVVPLVTDVDFI